ncbi:Casein kinase I isoform alpha [Orchesella cincta]|uniref:Casein kinase I isoform alpha n=1 Tax=Orchesella cincta TaxID=48709 RepID=A0A1D2MLG3_ORCCI|nr:Casein kinase I isoform alpha [Orchesella cincta]
MSASPGDILIDSEDQFIIGNKYKLVRKIGTGSFGEVYLGVNISNPSEQVAIKLESVSAPNQILQWECQVYLILQGSRAVPQFKGFKQDRERGYNVLVMELMGPSLAQLFELCSRRFSVKTVLMLADQMLELVSFLHCMNHIHRDIKPENFLMGRGSKSHKVYMVDFGLAKQYRDPRTLKHIPILSYKQKMVGTSRYVSINVHNGTEASRRDDLESLAYVFIYFLRGNLPWMNVTGATKKQKYDKIKEAKLSISVEKLCKGIPRGFGHFLSTCRDLKFDEIPDYDAMRNKFQKMFKRMGYQQDNVYDWMLLKELGDSQVLN